MNKSINVYVYGMFQDERKNSLPVGNCGGNMDLYIMVTYLQKFR